MGIVTADITVTLDGYGAGPNQRLDAPMGDFDVERVHAWQIDHAADNADEAAGVTEADAFVMGRNMFTPGRGAWDSDWTGFWGDEPPYRAPVFVLTHHPREPIRMQGGTTFYFVTDGIVAALDQARDAAGSGDVAIAGGATTINQYVAAGLVDELRLHVAPMTTGLNNGSRIFDGTPPVEFEVVAARHTPHVTHLTYRQAAAGGQPARPAVARLVPNACATDDSGTADTSTLSTNHPERTRDERTARGLRDDAGRLRRRR